MWLFSEPALPIAIAEAKGCFGHICQQPANAYGSITLTFFSKLKTYISIPSRSINWLHNARTLSNNRRTLSPASREKCFRNCFILGSNRQNQEDLRSVRTANPSITSLFDPESTIKQNIKIKCANILCAPDGVLRSTHDKDNNQSKEIRLYKGVF
jgi:hypothetical protein